MGIPPRDPFQDLTGGRAVWRPLGDSVAWELVGAEAVAPAPALATMRSARPAYVVQTGTEEWDIEESSRRFGYRVTVRRAGTHKELAVLTWPWHWLGTFRSATLLLAGSGRSFAWKRDGSVAPVWTFHANDSGAFVRFRSSGTSRGGADVEISANGFHDRDLPLLLSLGWFLVERHSLVVEPPIGA